MMRAAVVDASVAVKWLVHEPDSDAAIRLASFDLTAPSLLLAECANALWAKVQRRELDPGQAREGNDALRVSSVKLVPLSEVIDRAMELALELQHPIYDCCYLAVAIRDSVPIVTADRRFIHVLRAHATYAERVVPLNEVE